MTTSISEPAALLKRRKTVRTWLIVATILYVLASPIALLTAGVSFMSFDAPGSENNPATKLFVFSLATVPVTIVAAIVLSWVLFYLRKHSAALASIFLPFANVALFVIALIWLEVAYGGSFSGR